MFAKVRCRALIYYDRRSCSPCNFIVNYENLNRIDGKFVIILGIERFMGYGQIFLQGRHFSL